MTGKQYDVRMNSQRTIFAAMASLWLAAPVLADDPPPVRVTQCYEWDDRFEYVLKDVIDEELRMNKYCIFSHKPASQAWQHSLKCVVKSISENDSGVITVQVMKPVEFESKLIANDFLEGQGYTLEARCADDPAEMIPYHLWEEMRLKHAEMEATVAQASNRNPDPY